MVSLEAAFQQKLEAQAADRCARQQARIRLTADPTLAVSSIQKVLTEYMRHHQTKDLWSLVAPPPNGPHEYGWHTAPQPEWVSKTCGLLYDLVGLAPNTKLHSTKLVKAMKAMIEQKDMAVELRRGQTLTSCLDRMDLTIRVLLNQVRTLKCNSMQRGKVCRMLGAEDKLKLEMLLERVVLPKELLQADPSFEEDDVPLGTISVAASVPVEQSMALAVVPYGGQAGGGKTSKGSVLSALPKIFQSFVDELQGAAEAAPSSLSQADSSVPYMKSVLESAAVFAPLVSSQPVSKAKGGQSQPAKQIQKKVKKVTKKKAEQGPKQAVVEKKAKVLKKPSAHKKQAQQPAPTPESSYKAGEMQQHRAQYVDELMKTGDYTRSQAASTWTDSLRRAKLLQHMSVAELVKRRFVQPGCKSNPFAERVKNAEEAVNVD